MAGYRRLRVLEKRQETAAAFTFVLQPADGLPYPYESGQFVTLIFQVHGKEQRRAYSFSSAPEHDALPAITIKRVANGEFSNFLIHNIQVGDELEALDATGRFLLPPPQSAEQQLFFIAAGSGITPVFSLLKTLLHREDNTFATLIYANRNAADTIFKATIDDWMARFPDRFQCIYIFSAEAQIELPHVFAHLNNGLLLQLIEQYAKVPRVALHFYLCAPEALQRMAEITLRYMGFKESQIQKETFFIRPVDVEFLPTVDANIRHRVRTTGRRHQHDFEVFEGETILDGALRQGIMLPYNCKSGVCTACTAKCLSGEVEMLFNGSKRLGQAGEIVYTCIGYAHSEAVELEFQ